MLANRITQNSIAPYQEMLIGWFAARRILGNSGVPADNTAISSASDLTAYANNATQATGSKQPTFQENEINGQPVMRFVAANAQVLVATNQSQLNPSDGVSVYAVFKTPASLPLAAAQGILYKTSSSGDIPYGIYMTTNVINWRTTGSDDVVKIVSAAAVSAATTYVVEGYNNLTTTSIKINNSAAVTDTVNGLKTSNQDVLQIGNTLTSIARYYNGDIAELLIYKGVLTSSQRENIRKYLGAIYGVTVS